MTDELVYAALITLSMPGSGQSTEVTVVLTPPDNVNVAEQVKPLAECTLTDLQTFADELEADVWKAYEAISLLELDEQADVSIDVTVVDRKGKSQSLADSWRKQAIIIPATATVVEEAKDVAEEIPVQAEIEAPAEETAVIAEIGSSGQEQELELEEKAEPEAVVEELESEEPPVEDVEEAENGESESESVEDSEAEDPEVVVSDSEPVYAEPEESAGPSPDDVVIAPSKARVRIAGRRLPTGTNTWMAADVLIDEPPLRAAQAHALSSPSREVAGVLLGPPPEKQPDGRYVVHVMDTIIAKYTVMQGASVTYTPESWRYMNDKLQERYPDETAVMVGWYHTHPGFGIFLSGMDQFIHQNFFTQIWHVALVLDPHAKKSGFFCWDRQKTGVSPMDFEWPNWAAQSW
jgi:proteasome lid subunit RPN8/RPN11